MLWRTKWPGRDAVFGNSCGVSYHNLESAVDRGQGDRFSRGYFAARPSSLWSKTFCDRITSCVKLWNKGAYNELVKKSYRAEKLIYGKNTVPQSRSNVIIIFQTLFCMEICVNPFGLFLSGTQVEFW